MRALIIAGSGFIGRRVAARLGERGVSTYCAHPSPGGLRFDATRDRLKDLLAQSGHGFTHALLLSAVADIEACARDPFAARKLNIDGMTEMLDDLLAAGIKPVFASSDYVFDGTRALWREADTAVPRTVYGAQKLAIERWLANANADHLILRYAKAVSGEPDTSCMLAQWARDILAGKPIRCADDQYFCPLFVDDLAGATVRLMEDGASGIFHVAGPQRISRLDLLRMLVGAVRRTAPHIDPAVEACKLHELPFREMRPLDTSLDIGKLDGAIAWPFKPMQALCDEIAAARFGAPLTRQAAF
jgi:dTDP-4-dehydrorhamnose reductase